MAIKVEVTQQKSKQDYEKDPDTNKNWTHNVKATKKGRYKIN
jgi:hypothetical protein